MSRWGIRVMPGLLLILRRLFVLSALMLPGTCDLGQLASAQEAGDQRTFERLTDKQYRAAFAEFLPQGFRPSYLKVEVVGNTDYYSLVMTVPETPIDCHANHLLTREQFQSLDTQYLNRGFRRLVHQRYVLSNIERHAVVWIRPSLSRPTGIIWDTADEIPASGKTSRYLEPIDRMLSQFMFDHQVPGATMAISRNGQIVYQRGFGYRQLENERVMEPDTLLRIASVSKPVTAAAIMQLVDRGQMELDQPLFADLHKLTAVEFDPRWQAITLDHLLRHRAGWDRVESFDPMFRQHVIARHFQVQIPVEPEMIMRYMLEHPLQHDPGRQFAYSNFGYSVLGRAIERASEMTYQQYVVENVFRPLGIRGARVGRTRFDERDRKESCYYPRDGRFAEHSRIDAQVFDVPVQYGGWYQESLDAHGGLIATAADLVRFASSFDQPDQCPIMSSEAVREMFLPVNLDEIELDEQGIRQFYAYGWQVVALDDGERFNCYHMGRLPGSSAILVRRHDGFNWAVLFNSDNSADGQRLASRIDPLIHQAVDAVTRWPNRNQR
ncbi:MAG: serine hydrolase domain-containing protein [Pirellulaceae bacterium]